MAIGIFFDEFHISQDEQKLKEFILIDGVARYFKEAYVYDNRAYESLQLEYGLWLPGTDYYYRKIMAPWSEEIMDYFRPVCDRALFITIDRPAEDFPRRILLESGDIQLKIAVREECGMDKVTMKRMREMESISWSEAQRNRLTEWDRRIRQAMQEKQQEGTSCQKNGETVIKKKKRVS